MGLTTTREFRWDDPAAPVLNGEPGTFYHLLKTCLVGTAGIAYGSGTNERRAAGWELVWDDPAAFKAVFRNSQAHGGSGCYLRVLDDGSSQGQARLARIDVYEQMSDIDTGTGTAGGGFVWKANSNTGASRAYTLHADERTLYCTTYAAGAAPPAAVGAASGAYVFGMMAGDIEPVIPSDPGVAVACGVNASSPVASQAFQSGFFAAEGGAALFGFSLSRAPDLTNAVTHAYINTFRQGLANINAIGGTTNVLIPADLPAGLNDSLYAPALVLGERAIRGRARGLFIPLNSQANTGLNVGSVVHPLVLHAGMSLACLAGCTANAASSVYSGRLFVERHLSWDDV